MDWPLPVPWTNTALAGYFGDRACPFCDHRNLVAAKFCNDCGTPLKPCNQCYAVNHQAATNCYNCGAEYPASFTKPETTPALPAADPTPAWATPGDVRVAATVTQPLFAAGALRPGWGLATMAAVLIWGLGAIATILIAGAYTAYRINATVPDVMEVASRPIATDEHNAPAAPSVVPAPAESKPVEPETTVALLAPIPTSKPEERKGASARQRPAPVPATKRTSVRQRPVASVPAPVAAAPPAAQTLAAAPVGAPVAETREARRPDSLEAMHVSLATCGGDLFARIACDQRVRRHFCEGRWGEARECAGGVANDHGQ
jgi:Double zinc ribbon